MTKEEILNNEIKDEPFYLSENLEPHIYKAMEIYAKQYRQEQVTLGLPSVSKCSFDCDNPVYEDGASYCKEHMECDDWT